MSWGSIGDKQAAASTPNAHASVCMFGFLDFPQRAAAKERAEAEVAEREARRESEEADAAEAEYRREEEEAVAAEEYARKMLEAADAAEEAARKADLLVERAILKEKAREDAVKAREAAVQARKDAEQAVEDAIRERAEAKSAYGAHTLIYVAGSLEGRVREL